MKRTSQFNEPTSKLLKLLESEELNEQGAMVPLSDQQALSTDASLINIDQDWNGLLFNVGFSFATKLGLKELKNVSCVSKHQHQSISHYLLSEQ